MTYIHSLSLRPGGLVVLFVIVLLASTFGAVLGYWFRGAHEAPPSQNEEFIKWLARTPCSVNPPIPPEERRYYKSFDEWITAGRRIPGVENQLLGRLAVGNSAFHPEIIIHALGCVGSEKSVTALIKIIEDPRCDSGTLEEAIHSLGALRSHRAMEPLCKLALSARDPEVAFAVIEALDNIGDPGARPVIEELRRKRQFTEFQEKVIQAILHDLGQN